MSFDPNLYLKANPGLNDAYNNMSSGDRNWWTSRMGPNVFDNPQTFAMAHANHVSMQPHGDYMNNYQNTMNEMIRQQEARAMAAARAQQAAFVKAMQDQQMAMQQQQQAMMDAIMQQQSQFSPTQESGPEGTTYINQGEAPAPPTTPDGVAYFASSKDRDTGATTLTEAGMFGNSLANRRTGFGSALMYV